MFETVFGKTGYWRGITNVYVVLVKAGIDTGRTRRRIWLRHRATSRKVAGPIPDGFTGIH